MKVSDPRPRSAHPAGDGREGGLPRAIGCIGADTAAPRRPAAVPDPGGGRARGRGGASVVWLVRDGRLEPRTVQAGPGERRLPRGRARDWPAASSCWSGAWRSRRQGMRVEVGKIGRHGHPSLRSAMTHQPEKSNGPGRDSRRRQVFQRETQSGSRSSTASRSTSRRAASPRSWDPRARASPRCSTSSPGSTSRRSGTVRVAGAEVSAMSAGAARRLARAARSASSSSTYNLLPVLTAYQNVELPLLLTNLSKKERAERVRDRARRRGAGRPAGPLPAPALGRPGAARRHRARHRGRPDADPARRAHRPARREELAGGARAAPAAQRRVREDDHRW